MVLYSLDVPSPSLFALVSSGRPVDGWDVGDVEAVRLPVDSTETFLAKPEDELIQGFPLRWLYAWMLWVLGIRLVDLVCRHPSCLVFRS